MPKLIIRHNLGTILAANSRLLLSGQCRRWLQSRNGTMIAAFVGCLNLPILSRNLAQYRPYTKPIGTFTMAFSSKSRRARVRPMDGTLLGHVSLLPEQTILEVRKPEFGTALIRCCDETKCWWPEFRPELASKYIIELSFQQRHDIGNRSSKHFCRCWTSVGPYPTSHLNKCEFPKLIIRHNLGTISAANSRLLLSGQCRRLLRSCNGTMIAAFVGCLNLPIFSRNLAQYRPYTKPISTLTMASSFGSRRARVQPMDGTLLGQKCHFYQGKPFWK